MTRYIQLHFAEQDERGKEILIALLAHIGFEGFEEGPHHLDACIAETEYREEAVKEVVNPEIYPYTVEIITQKNWNEAWEKSFGPVIIDNFCAIRANFHPPAMGVEHELVITPKMSFGTGHHATTLLVIRLMQAIDFSRKKVLDFGTGTGVLAILAEKLGADAVVAVDNDDWSIMNAEENIAQNACKRIVLEKADSIYTQQTFDIILANINKNVIIDNLSLFAKHLKPPGVLVLSGLLTGDYSDVADEAVREHLIIDKHVEKTGWIALQLKGNAP